MSGRVLVELSELAARAIRDGLGVDAEPDVRPTGDPRHGDYQVNGVLPLARELRDNPRKLAARVVERLEPGGMLLAPEIAGPGFVNLRLDPAWVARTLGSAAVDERMGVAPVAQPRTIVVDFSSPNVAKRMHVGHLRSTIIGDALVRTLRFLGHRVVGDNHVGDWGTQFGILLWAWKHARDEAALAADGIGELERLYKLGNEAQKADPAVADACRAELASLQAGEGEARALWERFVAISRADAERLYARLEVSFDSWRGESAYEEALPGVVETLLARGIARESQGAIAIFYPDDPDLAERPFLVRKSDGAFLYATTDLATIGHRVEALGAERLVYVVDVRQSLHFRQLFSAARLMGFDVQAEHVGFGMMLGADGRPFRTRDGGTVTLEALLAEAEERILPIVRDRWPRASEEEARHIAARVGIGAVKYADLAQNLTTDYRFDWNKLLAADGNTGPYLQYTLVRIRSVLREHETRTGAAFHPDGAPLVLATPEELDLATELLKLGDTLDRVALHLRPHVLCEYLYGLARKFNPFYAKCPILGTEDERLRRSRLTLCALASRALEIGLGCLNLPLLDRM